MGNLFKKKIILTNEEKQLIAANEQKQREVEEFFRRQVKRGVIV